MGNHVAKESVRDTTWNNLRSNVSYYEAREQAYVFSTLEMQVRRCRRPLLALGTDRLTRDQAGQDRGL